MNRRNYKVAIAGATGAVGSVMREILEERDFPIASLKLLASERSEGRQIPFKGENITSLIYSIMNQEPDKPSNVNPRVPLLFDHVIMKALAKDQATRYQKASEIVTDMHEFVESFAIR